MQPSSISRSGEKRESVMMRAQVWMPGARTPSDHRIRNLSLSGACIGQPAWLKRGDTIRVTMGHVHDVDATVMWIAGDSCTRSTSPPRAAAGARASSRRAGWAG